MDMMQPTWDTRNRPVAAPSHDDWTNEEHMDYGGPGTALQEDEARSLGVGEPLHQTPRSWASHLRAWAPEVGCILLAIGLFVALTVVLDTCNDNRLPQWPLGLTLNTVVALLATLCRSIIVLPVADAISQFKWNWFATGHRPIKDLYIFDQASRGPWGSLRLLSRMRGRLTPLSHAAALVLVSGVATSFLTQSAVSYEERLVVSAKSGNATISRASMFPSTVDDDDSNGELEGLKRAALQATFLDVNGHWPVPEPVCPSGNCDYPVYRSLGLCVSMQNVTSALTYDEFEGRFGVTMVRASLLKNTVLMEDELDSNTMAFNATSLEPRIRMAGDAGPDTSQMTFEEADEAMDKAMQKYVWPPEWTSVADWDKTPDVLSATIAQFFFIWSTGKGLDEDMHNRYRAAEVLWHFCVHEYNTTARDGVAATERLGSVTKVDEVIKQRGPCSFVLADAGGQDKFRITDSYTYSELDRMFRRAFSGAWSRLDFDMDYSEITAQMANNLFFNEYEYASDGWFRQTVEEWDVIMWDNLGKMTATIAQSFTAQMRKTAMVDSKVEGDVLQTETFVVVRWPWLSALAAQIGLTIVFVVGVAVHAARLGVAIVKSNNLAELFAQNSSSRRSSQEQDDGVAGGWTVSSTGIKTQVDEAARGRLVRDREAWILQVQKDEIFEAKLPDDSVSGSSS